MNAGWPSRLGATHWLKKILEPMLIFFFFFLHSLSETSQSKNPVDISIFETLSKETEPEAVIRVEKNLMTSQFLKLSAEKLNQSKFLDAKLTLNSLVKKTWNHRYRPSDNIFRHAKLQANSGQKQGMENMSKWHREEHMAPYFVTVQIVLLKSTKVHSLCAGTFCL